MIDDMTMRKLSEQTQIQSIRAVKKFARFIKRSPSEANAEDVRLRVPTRYGLSFASQTVVWITKTGNLLK